MVVAVLALAVAAAGTAAAGPLATTSVLNKKEQKQTKRIATNIVNNLAPGLAVKSASSATNADAVDGVSEEAFTVGRSAWDDSCDPMGGIVDCVGTTLSLPRSGRVLVVAAGGQVSVGGVTAGQCRIEVDDATTAVQPIPFVEPGEATMDNTDDSQTNGFAVTAVSSPLGAGSHTFELSCNQGTGDIKIQKSTISAVMVGSG